MNKINLFATKISLTYQSILRYFTNKKLKREILNFYVENPTDDKEMNHALDYIKKNGIAVFPYPFNDNHNSKDVILHKDDNGLFYTIRNKKKLYFRRDMTYKSIRNMYNSLLIEQEIESAHRYLTENFNVTENDILVDIGCAEGFLALDVVEKAKKIYLFEYEDAWIEALQHTFAPWKEKVEIIKKYVSDQTDDNNIAIDHFFENREDLPTFVKIDVEGAEMQVLNGMQQTINKANHIKLAVCTYHKQNDYEDITSYISNIGLNYTTSKNYMLCDDIKPYFRKGLIRVKK